MVSLKSFVLLGVPLLAVTVSVMTTCVKAESDAAPRVPLRNATVWQATPQAKYTTMTKKIPPVPSLDPTPAVPQAAIDSFPAVPLLAVHQDSDLVSLAEIDPTIVIDIQFARSQNPFHYQFFRENEAYVRYATAKKIAAVQRDLLKRGLRLKIWSAYRPMPVQIKMYDIVGHNGNWVSDPYNDKSKKAHVRGVAIDCTLVDKHGRELEMPTGYLDFKKHKEMAADYLELPPKVIHHRTLLRDVMLNHGMSGYSKEWWHFQDNKLMAYPVITMADFPELHRRMLVDEMLTAAKP